MFHSKGKTLLWLAALVTLLSLGLASKPLGVNADATGTIVIKKETDPPGGIDFSFLDDFGIGLPDFSLDDGATLTFSHVPAPFTYTITETLPIGWELTGLSCVEDGIDNSIIDPGAGQVTINLEASETITCTFNNAALGTILLRKRTIPPGGTGFEFTDPFGINLPSLSIDDGDTLPIYLVPAGKYYVTEADPTPFGFELIDVDCEDPDGGSSVDLEARTATIDLDAGETITCTFTNGVPPVPIGGIVVPVNSLGLVLPWLGVAALASFAALTVALARRRRG